MCACGLLFLFFFLKSSCCSVIQKWSYVELASKLANCITEDNVVSYKPEFSLPVRSELSFGLFVSALGNVNFGTDFCTWLGSLFLLQKSDWL